MSIHVSRKWFQGASRCRRLRWPPSCARGRRSRRTRNRRALRSSRRSTTLRCRAAIPCMNVQASPPCWLASMATRARRAPKAQRRGAQDAGSDGERPRSSFDRGGRTLGSGAGRAHRAATPQKSSPMKPTRGGPADTVRAHVLRVGLEPGSGRGRRNSGWCVIRNLSSKLRVKS